MSFRRLSNVPPAAAGWRKREVGLAERGEGLVCRDCGSGSWRPLARETVEFLLRIGDENLMMLQQRSPTNATLDEVEAVCAEVRRSFLQRELKSYRVIRETLAGIQE